MKEKIVKNAKILCPLIIAVLFFFVFSKIVSSAEFHADTIQYLDEKKNTVMELTAAATAASAAITLIPGDTATPIAEKFADLSTYFIIVVCAIFLEKYLLTITGYLSFKILIPIACLLFSFNVLKKNNTVKLLARRLLAFALAVFFVIPFSVMVSRLVEDTYQSSIEQTIDSAEDAAQDTKEADQQGLFSGIISKVTEGINGVMEKFEGVLNNFIEALAVMIVTSCLIPVLVMMFFVWLVKIVIGSHIELFQNNA